MKHSPEPWFFEPPKVVKDHARGITTHLPAEMQTADRKHRVQLTPDNMERIVACVNACKGMADPVAEVARLKRKASAVDDLVGFLVRVSRETMTEDIGDDGGFGSQNDVKPTPFAKEAATLLTALQEANK